MEAERGIAKIARAETAKMLDELRAQIAELRKTNDLHNERYLQQKEEIHKLRGAMSARDEMDNGICQRLGIPGENVKPYYLIHFEDPGMSDEIFTDADAAEKRFEALSMNWNVSLFQRRK